MKGLQHRRNGSHAPVRKTLDGGTQGRGLFFSMNTISFSFKCPGWFMGFALGVLTLMSGCASLETGSAASTGSRPEEVSASRTPLAVVAEFPNQQVTGVAVSKSGRVFANFPYWSDGHVVSVVELGPNGEQTPFPDGDWNRKTADPADRFVCVQSVYVDDADNLWIVDAGSPKQTGVVEGGAKLVKVDLTTNRIAQVIPFNRTVAPEQSYLNDVRVDTRNNFAFLTDSNLGAIIVVDLRTGEARRLLENDPSVKPEPNISVRVDDKLLIDPEKDRPLAIASDGIALDREGGWLYYKALSARTLYRVKVEDLEAAMRSENVDLANRVERVGQVPPSDGLAFHNGQLYVTSIEDGSIVRYDPVAKTSHIVAMDDRLSWPDSFAVGPDGSLYVTTSQIHLTPRFNQGQTRVKDPYRVLRIAARDLGGAVSVAE
jgi:sugar lactone lactonase YvrE